MRSLDLTRVKLFEDSYVRSEIFRNVELFNAVIVCFTIFLGAFAIRCAYILIVCSIEYTRKYSLRGYILGILIHTTAWH